MRLIMKFKLPPQHMAKKNMVQRLLYALKENQYSGFGGLGFSVLSGIILILGILIVIAHYDGTTSQEPIQPSASTHHQAGHAAEETPPETFVLLELFSEALESHIGGIGVKIAELQPKVEHIQTMYQEGEKHKAFAKALGIATEVIMIGFLIETFGIGELFIASLSFQENWLSLMAQSMVGIMLSTKIALFIGEKVEEAAEHRYEHEVHAEEIARRRSYGRLNN